MYRHNLIEKVLILQTIGCYLIKSCYPNMYTFLKALYSGRVRNMAFLLALAIGLTI